MLSGNNGILKKSRETQTQTNHANILEQIQIEQLTYLTQITTSKNTSTLIEYLQSKSIIGNEIGENTGKYQINVATLLGAKQKLGNGDATVELKDVYMLEKQSTSTGSIVNTQVATIMPVKIAATEITEITYKVVYYGSSTSENIILGSLKDYDNNSNEKKYSVQGGTAAKIIDLDTNKPTTFEKIYVIYNGEKIDITDAKEHRDEYYTEPGVSEELEWDRVDDSFYGLMNEKGYGALPDVTYEFIIEKNGKEYRGTAEILKLM